MPPRTFTNPAPKTEAAKAQLNAFYCELCGKGYARQNEFAAHESSYEHNHNQRRKDLKNMMGSKASSSSNRNNPDSSGLIGIKPISLAGVKVTGKSGKKPAFKNAFASSEKSTTIEKKHDDVEMTDRDTEQAQLTHKEATPDSDEESDYEHYSPWHPTTCGPECAAFS